MHPAFLCRVNWCLPRGTRHSLTVSSVFWLPHVWSNILSSRSLVFPSKLAVLTVPRVTTLFLTELRGRLQSDFWYHLSLCASAWKNLSCSCVQSRASEFSQVLNLFLRIT